MLRWFSRRRSGTTSAECAGLAGLKIWLEYLLQIIRPWNGEFNTGAADSTLLSKSANVESLWSCFRHCHMRFVEASFAAEKFGSRYSGSHTKPTRAARSIFAQEPSAQPLQEFAAQWTLNMLHSRSCLEERPSREEPSVSAPNISLRTKLAGNGPQGTPKGLQCCLTRYLT